MKSSFLDIIKKFIVILPIIGILMILSSPIIGDEISPDSLWWIEPIAYLGASIFIISCIILYLIHFFNKNKIDHDQEIKSWGEVTQDYFDTFAHDIGRPLRRILGKEREVRAVINETGSKVPRMVTELIDEIEQQSPNFRLMIENVRVLVDLENPNAKPSSEPVEPASVIRNITDRYIYVGKEKGVDLVWWSDPSDFGIVFGDASALDHIVTNIVDNATKFAKNQIEISLTKDENYYFVKVWDDGKGIEKSHLPHIFNRGWTPELAARSEKQSSGIGLFIADSLTTFCNGTLDVNSSFSKTSEDKGTTFILRLPLDNRSK
ncbi:MAG: sensor histidine kinase [Dehalococcoidia bacterium]